ncbi:MAG: hypothetical protein ACP5M7_10005, partial [Thermoproteota archaeon]
MNDAFRASIAGGFAGSIIGAKVGQIIGSSIAIDLALKSVGEGYGSQTHLNLASIAEKYGDLTLSKVSELIRDSSNNLKDVLSLEQVKELVLASTNPSKSAEEIVSSLELISKLPKSFVESNYESLLNAIYDPTSKERIAFLSTLSREEISKLCEQFSSLDSVFYTAYRQKLGDISSIAVDSNIVYVPKEVLGKEEIKEGDLYEFLVNVEGEEKYVALQYIGKSYDGKLMFSPYEGVLSISKAVPVGKVVFRDSFFIVEEGEAGLTKVSAFISPDGVLTVQGKRIDFLKEPKLQLVSGELTGDASKINEIALVGKVSTKTGEYSLVFVENKNPYVIYGSSYLPAVLIETKEGVKIGDTVALFDGGSLVISSGELASRGIKKYDILNIVYPNGEVVSKFYTGGDLVIPSNGYTGAFVDIRATTPKLSGLALSQVEAAYNLLSKEVSVELADSFAKLVLEKLTEAQVLDISSTIVGELPSLRVLGSEELRKIISDIVDYESKGKSAEERLKEILKESNEYVKAARASSEEIISRIEVANPRLAEELRSIVKKSFEEDPTGKLTNELLEFVKENYHESAYVEYEEAESKKLEEELSLLKLDDPSVKEQLASIIPKLKNVKYYEFRNIYVEKVAAEICFGQTIEGGKYFVRATAEDGKVYEWTTQTGGTRRIVAPNRYADELKGKMLKKLQLISYIAEAHFPKKFSISDHSLELDFARKTLIIDGKEVKATEIRESGFSEIYGSSIVVETNLKSLIGTEINFALYEDGTVGLYTGGRLHTIRDLSFEPGNILTITYSYSKSRLGQAVIPLEPKPLLIGVPIELGELSVNVEGKETVTVGNVLKKVFGYDGYKTLQTKIESGEVGVIFKFDNGYDAFCRDSEFNVHVSVGAKRITAVKVYPVIKEINVEKVNEAIINKIKEYVGEYK